MARTKASVGAKVASGKSSKARCSAAPPPSSSVSSGSSDRPARSHGGGNPMCPRETPKWQRPITNFFIGKENQQSDEENDAGTSTKPKSKRNVIHSDDEETESTSTSQQEQEIKPVNTVLDDTIELEPLTGDNCHKIEEYYPKNGVKGKGKGKKTNKENIDSNIKRRKSVKRDLEEDAIEDDIEQARTSKKIKV